MDKKITWADVENIFINIFVLFIWIFFKINKLFIVIYVRYLFRWRCILLKSIYLALFLTWADVENNLSRRYF